MAIEKLSGKKLLMVSDVHSNIIALNRVLSEEEHQFEGIINLGDIVGYGPNPNSTLDKVLEFPNISVYGNHDIVACEVNDPINFNLYAYTVIMWTRKVLTQKNKDFLANLPYPHIQENFVFAHGNHENCEEYVMSIESAQPIMHYLAGLDLPNSPSICFIGHTHLPMVFKISKAAARRGSYEELSLETPQDFPHEFFFDPDFFYVVNIGSVGQPRDHDPRSSYSVLDTRDSQPRLTMKRLEYDIPTTQESMTEFGLPQPMISRLSRGI